MPLSIIHEDITRVRADAIVNTANPEPVVGRGTDADIYDAAGYEQLLAERKKIGAIGRGEAAVTPAFGLQARFIIHTVGPVWKDGLHGEREVLASCYRKSLLLARQLGCESIAFPLISAGTYGFPREEALTVALQQISAFLQEEDMDITMAVYDPAAFRISRRLRADVSAYIASRMTVADAAMADMSMAEECAEEPSLNAAPESAYESLLNAAPVSAFRKGLRRREREEEREYRMETGAPLTPPGRRRKLADVIKEAGETFQERLFRLIDERGLTDPQVYRKANVDRKLFSKIRCDVDYKPKKQTAIALGIALELNLDEMKDLLARAGYALSPSDRYDLIIRYCLENQIYDIYDINAMMFDFGEPGLGA